MPSWETEGPITGSGTLTLDPTWAGLIRIQVTSFGLEQPFGVVSNPQQWQQVGWIAVWDHDPAPDGLSPEGDWLGPPTWLNFQYTEFDFTEHVATIQGATGLAYALYVGYEIMVHAYLP